MKFPQNFNYGGKNIREMGPRQLLRMHLKCDIYLVTETYKKIYVLLAKVSRTH